MGQQTNAGRRGGPDGEGEDDVDGHDHRGAGERMGWLLLAPIAALLLVAPPTLGSYGVGRGARVDIRAGAEVLDPLPRGAGPVRMTLLELGQRAFDHDSASFNGAAVQLTGFVAAPEGPGSGWPAIRSPAAPRTPPRGGAGRRGGGGR